MFRLKSYSQPNWANFLWNRLLILRCCGKLHAAFNQGFRVIGPALVFLSSKSPFFASVAELVDALDLGSSVLGCESSSLSTRTIFYPV